MGMLLCTCSSCARHERAQYTVARRAHVRVKVTIRCKCCGEKFILRGKREKGRIETGFKQCICDNRDAFHIDEEPI